jgi:hypothetical protein
MSRANRQHGTGRLRNDLVGNRSWQMRGTHEAFGVPEAEDDQIRVLVLGYFKDFLRWNTVRQDGFRFTPYPPPSATGTFFRPQVDPPQSRLTTPDSPVPTKNSVLMDPVEFEPLPR